MRSQQIAVVAPTASGKSDLAMSFATETEGMEIICVDAMQVYRRMDIGTAKPTAQDRSLVTHHGVDLVEPFDSFGVTDFQAVAAPAAKEITERDGIALFVAGTGLYLKSLTDHFDPPGRWPDIRAELEALTDIPALHARLAVLDPLAASKMESTNARRVIRALEVCLGSGRAFSSYGPGVDAYPPSEVTQIGLRWPRDALTKRITARVHMMMANGLLEEVASLHADERGMSATARQALGYKELIEHLDGEMSLEAAVSLITQRTRQFAVRQERWFRRDPRIRWIDLAKTPLEALPVLRSLV